jgi:hypothetical protein
MFQKGTSPLVVTARIGDAEGRVALSATEPESYVVGNRSGTVTVSVKWREIARLSRSRRSGPPGVQAVLGMDALKDSPIQNDKPMHLAGQGFAEQANWAKESL